MSAGGLAGVHQINADTAGNTGGGDEVPGAPAPPSLTEGLRSDLSALVAGGVHPEHIPAIVDQGLERATDSLRGKLGGLRPAAGSVLQPGPSGGTAAAKAMFAGAMVRLRDAFKTPAPPQGD